jgi:hypothetical protein
MVRRDISTSPCCNCSNEWYANQLALTLNTPERTFFYVWHRCGEDAQLTLRLGPEART